MLLFNYEAVKMILEVAGGNSKSRARRRGRARL